MKVIIEDYSENGAIVIVRFDSQFGSGWAIWNSTIAPECGNAYDVEIDIEQRVDLSTNAQVVTASEMGICGDVTTLKLTAAVEEQDDDGMAYLRIGSDCLIMVESDERELKGKCLNLTVPVYSVELSPIGS